MDIRRMEGLLRATIDPNQHSAADEELNKVNF